MNRRAYKIRGLDCAEEIAILKREVGPLVGGEERLSFDLLNGKMIVDGAETFSDADLVKIVSRTGMGATPAGGEASALLPPVTFWMLQGRSIMTTASGAALLAAFLFQAGQHGFQAAIFPDTSGLDSPVVSVVLYLAAVVCGAWFIFPKAIFAARRLRPDMNLLMIVAVLGAIGIGEYFEAATVAFLFAVALLLESWSVGRARRAIAALMDLTPATARTIESTTGVLDEKPVQDVLPGATVQVWPGERIPLDGILSKGSTSINQAPITGESMPVEKSVGDAVFAGSINQSGAFEFKTTKPAADTTLARIIRMVEEAQSRRAPSEQWVETFARYYTPAMMLLALLVFLGPPLLLGGLWSVWFYQALVLLVIACPCALVISTPVSIVAGLSAAAHAGVLIKGGAYLEAPARLKAVALDKTGTLTRGEPEVQQILPFNGHELNDVLRVAASLEAQSEHPLARAILRKANEEGVETVAAEGFSVLQGKGAQGILEGRSFWIGSHRLLHEQAVESAEIHAAAERLEAGGHSVIAVGSQQEVWGLIGVADSLRPEAAAAVAALKSAGIKHIVMLTGDNEGTAQVIGKAAGVDEIRAELLPEDKVRAMQALVVQYKVVGMVGDGVNDAPALAIAKVGIAMGAMGSDAAIETADIALMSDDLMKLPWLILHSRRTLRVIQQNIAFALGVKVIFILLTLLGAASLWLAIAADMGASLLVVMNGLRLLRAR